MTILARCQLGSAALVVPTWLQIPPVPWNLLQAPKSLYLDWDCSSLPPWLLCLLVVFLRVKSPLAVPYVPMRNPVPVGKPCPTTDGQHLEQVPAAAVCSWLLAEAAWGGIPGLPALFPSILGMALAWQWSCGDVCSYLHVCHLCLPPSVTAVVFLHLLFTDEITAPNLYSFRALWGQCGWFYFIWAG